MVAENVYEGHMVSERTGEKIKCEVGSAVPLKEEITIQVKGRDLVGGIPKTVEVSSTMEEKLMALNFLTKSLQWSPPMIQE